MKSSAALHLGWSISCLSSFSSATSDLWTRQSTYTSSAEPATVSGSPVYTSGAAAVATQIKSDAKVAIQAFASALGGGTGDSSTQSSAETKQLFQSIIKGAVTYPINQSFGTSDTPSQDRLDSMAAAINKTMNSVNEVATKILSSSGGALHYDDLKECVSGLVQQGGLHTGESCVVNGMSVSGVSDIMTSVLSNFGDGAIPSDIVKKAAKALDPTFTAILPGESDFYNSVNNAITSVQASVSGQLVAALNDAQNCFQDAMKISGTYQQKLDFTNQCQRSTSGNSVYNDLKTLYLSITNQMVGYLQPNVIDSIHEISDNYLNDKDPSSDAAYFRSAIANTTSSIAASKAGNSVTYAYKLAHCLDDVVGVTDPKAASNIAAKNDCLSQPDGPAASVKEIVYGYIQQIYGVLPSQLAAKIESSGVAKLDPSSPDYNAKVSALHDTFMKTDVGPQYVTCYEAFVNCLFNQNNGALTKPGQKDSVCLLGDSCKATPDGLANPAVPLGRRSTPNRLPTESGLAPRSQPKAKFQQARIVRRRAYKSYLLASYNKAIGQSH